MTIQDRLERAVRQHAPVAELRAIIEDRKTPEIRRENEISHANAMDVRAMMSALSSLMERTRKDPLAHKLAASQELEDIEHTHLALGRLIRDLQA